MDKVLVDTNFLLMQFEYGLDVPSELLRIADGPFSILIPSVVMDELGTLAGRNGKRAAAARFALQNLPKLRARFRVEVLPSFGAADEWIIKYAQKNQVCVATNDVPLRRRLLLMGVAVIAAKGKSKLDFV